jgi:hypothetical protein
MSEVTVQVQNPKQTININNPSITIEIPDNSIEVDILQPDQLSIQVQNPVIEVNIGGPCDCGNGAGGAASIVEITYADMATSLAGATLTPGQFYNITDAAGTDLGFICQAVKADEITVNGTGGYLNADFQAVGDYTNTPETFGTQKGIWQAANEAGYAQGDVVIWNLLHYQLTNSAAIDGTDPDTNTAAYTLLDRATYTETYVSDWDISEFDYINEVLILRKDKRGQTEAGENTGLQYGNESAFNNTLLYVSNINVKNLIARFANNTIYANSQVYGITSGVNCFFTDMILENNASLYNISTGDFCFFTRIKIEQGATIADITLGDGASFTNITVLNGVNLANKTFSDNVSFAGNTIGLPIFEPETITDNIEGKRAIPGFSDIPGTIDITGLTTLDITAAWAQYRGIFNLTSSNATESIDTITNPPTAFPFTLRPAAGLVLTITGTAYAGIAAGQIALKATDYVLDGDKGEYIVLEIDPLGTGCLVEKLVVNGLI